jgi:hypothetical protein
MAARKPKKIDRGKLKVVADSLGELYIALGISVIMLQQTQKALKKDAVTLRINAFQLRDTLRELQRKQRSLFAELKKAGLE